MKDSEIEQRRALIADLAEDAQGSIEKLLVPFLLYGLAVPVGTGLSYYFGRIGLENFIWILWFVLMAVCPIFLNIYYRRSAQTKIKKAADTIFSSRRGSVAGGIILSFVLACLGK